MQKLKWALAIAVLALAAGVATADTALDVVAGCAQGGSNFGLEVTYDGTNTNAFLINDSPSSETRHIVEIFMRVDNGFTIAPGENHQIIRARDPGGDGTIWRLQLRRQGGGPQSLVVTMWMLLDSGSAFVGEKLITQGSWQRLTMDWQASSSMGAGDGMASLNKGAGTPKVLNNTDNFFVVNQQQLGAFAGIDAGTSGVVCHDNFTSRRAP